MRTDDLKSWLQMEGRVNADLIEDQMADWEAIRELRAAAPFKTKQPYQYKKTELNRERINTALKYRPGIYVDASVHSGYAKIVALITLGSYMPLALRMRRFQCKNNNRAEYYAVLLGDQVRGPNKHLPIYTDNSGCVHKQIVDNLVWIQRRDNYIADNWVKGHKDIVIKYP